MANSVKLQNSQSLQTQLKTFGFIFENMCARDLRAYSQNLGGELSYYHDRYPKALGLEACLTLFLAVCVHRI